MTRGPIATVLAVLATVSWAVPARAQSLGLYDNFSSGEIDPLRWRGYEYRIGSTVNGSTPGSPLHGGTNDIPVYGVHDVTYAPSAALDSVRRVVNGQAQIALTAYNQGSSPPPGQMWPTGKGRSGLRLNRPSLADHSPVVMTFRAAVTMAGVSMVPPDSGVSCGAHTAARAQVFGHFFNDGSSTGPEDLTGDILAAVSLERRLEQNEFNGPWVVRDLAEARVGRCRNAKCEHISWQATPFTRTWTVGTAHVLTINWRPGSDAFTFTLGGGGVAAESLTVPYTSADVTPPRGYAYDLRVEAHPTRCHDANNLHPPQRVSVDARFDNVHLDSAAATATR
jgi:hypothetical protein